MAKAIKIIEARDKSLKEGKGAFTVDGKMIDKPVWLAAEKTIARAWQDRARQSLT